MRRQGPTCERVVVARSPLRKPCWPLLDVDWVGLLPVLFLWLPLNLNAAAAVEAGPGDAGLPAG
jgi:hypothetical protein